MPTTMAFPDSHRADRQAVVVLVRWAVLSGVLLLALVAGLLVARRLSGALQIPLTAPALLVTGGLAALVAGALRAAWRELPPSATAKAGQLVRHAPTVALLAMAGSLSLRQASPLGLAGCWLLILGEEVWQWQVARLGWRPATAMTAATKDSATAGASQPAPTLPPTTTWAVPRGDLDTADVFQRMIRARDAEGRHILYGTFRADLAPDQRTAAIHVAFCPPFARTPQVEVNQIEGPDARIKQAQIVSYGARVDVRLARPSHTAERVLLEIHAREPGA